MSSLISKYRISIISTIVGAIMGYLYFYFIGCSSGSCSITSKPINSSIYGAILGILINNSFSKSNTNENR
ncbi:MAG: hypothetical protein EAZ07_05850 [Cytophagales bacterium]|nr:MAG: hypothetical protein EAZ07_05850 [Cytophagales bacterium]